MLVALLTYLMKPLVGGDSTGDVWIGLWDTSNTATFRWTNNNAFGPYKNWAPGQPDGYLDFFDNTTMYDIKHGKEGHQSTCHDKNDCVKMRADPMTPGLWDDVSCSSAKLGYLCECYLDPFSPTQAPAPTSSCQAGYLPAATSCYRIVEDVKTFDDAQAECAIDGASLASIEDGYEQGLMQFLLAVSPSSATSAWIGINDQNFDGEYTWISGWPVTYVNWDTSDAPSKGMCVTVRPSGFWLESECNQTHASVCKTTTNVPVTPVPEGSHCDDGWVEYEPTKTCYLIDTYRLPSDESTVHISYADAEKTCKSLGATLVSLHSPQQNKWFYLQTRFTLGRRKIWLGMHRSVEGLLHWEDGSLVNYVNWADNEPDGALQGTDCVTLYAGNKGLAEWSDSSCFELNAFACQKEAYEGQAPVCEPGWDHSQIRSDDCYFLRLPQDGVLSWHEAEAYCNQMASHLASILSFDDMVFVSNLLQQRINGNPESWVWTGFRRLPGSSDFTWSDGSTSRHSLWSDDQPDSDDDDCAAIELEGGYNRLNNLNCGLRRPFICKKRPSSVTPITPVPTSPPTGGCPGSRIGNKCYKLVLEPLSWDDARTACAQSPNGDLASIPIYAVQALMASLFAFVDADNIWLGMTSRMPNADFAKEFHWIDGTSMIFTNWGSGQPSLFGDEDYCVKMLTDPDAPGKWYDDTCDQRYAYVCQHDLVPNATPVPLPSVTPCPNGFEGTGSSCFRIETTERTFPNAMEMCRSVDGVLAPIKDGYENSFVELLMFSAGIESAWIGLRSDEGTSGMYEWSAEWPKTYINWAEQEPSIVTGCVASMYSEGWKAVDCFDSRASICRSLRDIPPTEPPIGPGLKCPENWYAYHQDCYLFDTGFTSDSLLNAFFKCSSIGAQPPSIHSRSENMFIRNILLNQITGRYVWLGLVLDEGRYKWMDGSLVDFTNWEDGEDPTLDDGKKCVWMVPDREGKWQRQDCSQIAEVVCMLFERPTMSPTTTVSPTQTTMKRVPVASGLSTGGIVGIGVGGSVAALIVLIWLCYCCEQPSSNQKEFGRNNSRGGLDHSIDEEGGVENVQFNEDVELRKKKETDSASQSVGSDKDSDEYEEKL